MASDPPHDGIRILSRRPGSHFSVASHSSSVKKQSQQNIPLPMVRERTDVPRDALHRDLTSSLPLTEGFRLPSAGRIGAATFGCEQQQEAPRTGSNSNDNGDADAPPHCCSPLRYILDPFDRDWLAAVKARRPSLASVTTQAVEVVFTSLELAAHSKSTAEANSGGKKKGGHHLHGQDLTLDAVERFLRRATGAFPNEASAFFGAPFAAEFFDEAKAYWLGKRAALGGQPLLREVQTHQVMEEDVTREDSISSPNTTPFYDREQPCLVMERRWAEEVNETGDTAAVVAEFLDRTVAACRATVAREELRAQQTELTIYELALLRRRALLPSTMRPSAVDEGQPSGEAREHAIEFLRSRLGAPSGSAVE